MATGQRTTATDSSIIRRAIADTVSMIDWTEAPLLRKFGTNNEKRFRLINWPQIKAEWLEDTMSPTASTLAEALDAVETGIDVAEGTYFRRSDVVKVDSELMHVTSVSGNTLTVVRGYAGTTAATHSSAAAIDIVTSAAEEGAEAATGHTTVTTNPYNYTQIFDHAVKVSKSQMKINDYAIEDTMAYHLQKQIGGNESVGGKYKAGELPKRLMKTFYYGRRNDGGSGPRSMGGFNEYVTTNVVDASSAPLTRLMVENLLEDQYQAGGDPDCLIMNTWGLRKFRQFFEGFITMDRSESRGGSRITMLQVPWGGRDLELMFDYWCPNNELYSVESDKLGWCEFDGWDVEDLPSTGLYEWKNISAEYTFVLKNQTAHGRIHSYSTST